MLAKAMALILDGLGKSRQRRVKISADRPLDQWSIFRDYLTGKAA